jgi:hypothetical protein
MAGRAHTAEEIRDVVVMNAYVRENMERSISFGLGCFRNIKIYFSLHKQPSIFWIDD